MTRTFVDAGVLIAAACGVAKISDRAFLILDNPDRTFFTSDFVRLEVVPKPTYHGYHEQVEFYDTFFANVRRVAVNKKLLEDAFHLACNFGLSGCDAIHMATAHRGKCLEFVTTEKPTRPLFRVPGIRVVSLQTPA